MLDIMPSPAGTRRVEGAFVPRPYGRGFNMAPAARYSPLKRGRVVESFSFQFLTLWMVLQRGHWALSALKFGGSLSFTPQGQEIISNPSFCRM